MSVSGKLWVGSIVVECKEFDRMIEFWCKALGYEVREPPSADWVVLVDSEGMGPNISFQKVPDGPGDDYRFHFDLYSSDPEGEVQRLLTLGATMREPARPDRDFVTLGDPDGNPFDVIDTRGFMFGQRVKKRP
jgi:catechol 2,3-dioxygenase-like lactoylglutathione lyase family enzyme